MKFRTIPKPRFLTTILLVIFFIYVNSMKMFDFEKNFSNMFSNYSNSTSKVFRSFQQNILHEKVFTKKTKTKNLIILNKLKNYIN